MKHNVGRNTRSFVVRIVATARCAYYDRKCGTGVRGNKVVAHVQCMCVCSAAVTRGARKAQQAVATPVGMWQAQGGGGVLNRLERVQITVRRWRGSHRPRGVVNPRRCMCRDLCCPAATYACLQNEMLLPSPEAREVHRIAVPVLSLPSFKTKSYAQPVSSPAFHFRVAQWPQAPAVVCHPPRTRFRVPCLPVLLPPVR